MRWCNSWNAPGCCYSALFVSSGRRVDHPRAIWPWEMCRVSLSRGARGLQGLPWVGTAPQHPLTAQLQAPHSRSTRLAQKIRPDVTALSARSRESFPSLPWLRTSTVSGRHHTRFVILNKKRFCFSLSKRSRDFQTSCSWQCPLDWRFWDSILMAARHQAPVSLLTASRKLHSSKTKASFQFLNWWSVYSNFSSTNNTMTVLKDPICLYIPQMFINSNTLPSQSWFYLFKQAMLC